jgi:3',5'-cyclic-AMP phosphodiesterase
MRLAWLSDIHLVFVREVETKALEAEYFRFVDQVRSAHPDGIVISGDIAEAHVLCEYLDLLEADFAGLPIYFVLGNHDFYRGSIRRQRRLVAEHCAARTRLTYLTPMQAPIRLTGQTALFGHDSWADGRFGMYDWSEVALADFEYVEELIGLPKESRKEVLQALGDEAAEHVRRLLPQALCSADHVLFVTHVPPFLDACLYRGNRASPDWAPHYACKCVGEALIELMKDRPQKRLTVLCGHTHEPAAIDPLPNVTVLAAKAVYGRPILQRILDVP